MKKIIFVTLAFFALQGCSSETSTKKNVTLETIKPVEKTQIHTETEPNKKDDLKSNYILLKDVNGEKIKLIPKESGFTFVNYENKIVILNFFATWCPPCNAEIPHLNNLQEKYKDDVKIISILLEDNKSDEEIKKFINRNQINYTITNSPANFEVAKEIGGVRSIPFMLIYDRNGDYSQHYMGAVPEEMIEVDIKRVL